MITKYNQFLDNKLNEGLWSSIKNLFGKLLQNVSDELKKPIDELTNKLSKTKDNKQIKIIISNYLKLHNTTLTNSLKETTDVQGLNKLVKDNLSVIYASITSEVKALGEENYSFEKIFADADPAIKKLFDKDEKNFNKRIDSFTKELIVLRAKKVGYDEKTIRAELEKPVQTPEEKAKTEEKKIDDAAGKDGKTENLDITYSEKLFEAEGDAPQANTPQANTPQANTPQAADDKKVETPAQTPEANDADLKKKEELFKKLKDNVKNWFDNAIYKRMNNALKLETQGGGSIEDKIKNMTTTKNKDSVTKIVDAITKTDKEKLKTVRDTLGLDRTTAPL